MATIAAAAPARPGVAALRPAHPRPSSSRSSLVARGRLPVLRGRSTNAIDNLQRASIASGFGFLGNTAGFDISQSLIPFSAAASTYGEAFVVGLLNTLLVAAIGIVLATILGFIIGIARLSKNWIVAQGCDGLCRDHPQRAAAAAAPVLVQRRAQAAAEAARVDRSRRRLLPQQPRPVHAAPDARRPGLAHRLGLRARRRRAASSSACWAKREQEATGRQYPVVLDGARPHRRPAGARSGSCWRSSAAARSPSTFRSSSASTSRGGMQILPEFVALLVGLVIYTAAFIAEIVRAGILAVSQGPDRSGPFARPAARADAAPRRHPAGDARHHPAADQPVPQPHQELLARRRHRLPGSGADLHGHRRSTRPATPSRCVAITMAVYLTISLRHLALHELRTIAAWRWWSGRSAR